MVNYTVKMFFYVFYRRSPMRCAMGWSMAGSGMYSTHLQRTGQLIQLHSMSISIRHRRYRLVIPLEGIVVVYFITLPVMACLP